RLGAAEEKIKNKPSYKNKYLAARLQYKLALERAAREHPAAAIAKGTAVGGLMGSGMTPVNEAIKAIRGGG
ncbi:MAG: hypothetical protein ACXAEU_25490, partial [Candidatus Hodarchaeales archaeon]